MEEEEEFLSPFLFHALCALFFLPASTIFLSIGSRERYEKVERWSAEERREPAFFCMLLPPACHAMPQPLSLQEEVAGGEFMLT